jgi:hypothetical protein
MDPAEAELMFNLTNDMEFAVSYFKVRRKINVMASLWLLIISCMGTFVSIFFIFCLGQHLDTVHDETNKDVINLSERRLINAFYLIFVYVGSSLIATLVCNKYL